MASYPIGFHSAGLHQYPIETVIEKVANAGYDCVELNAETLPWAKPHVTPQTSNQDRRRIRSKVKKAGLSISSISAHIDLVDAERRKRQENLNYALGCLDLAAFDTRSMDQPVDAVGSQRGLRLHFDPSAFLETDQHRIRSKDDRRG